MFEKLTAVTGLMFLASAGCADPIIYFGEDLNPGSTLPSGGNAEVAHNNFLSAISGVGTENMGGFSASATAPISLIFFGSTGPISAILDGTFTAPPLDAVWASPFDGRFATSGKQYWQTSDPFELAFSHPVSAFGFFANDGGDGLDQLTVRLGTSGGGVRDVVVPYTVSVSADGAVMFFSFTDSTATYSSISFLHSNAGNDFFGFDDWIISAVAVVPEPDIIDIKPGSSPDCGGAIPVAILGSDTLDVTQIDPATLSYEGLGVRQRGNDSLFCRVKDVNSDDYPGTSSLWMRRQHMTIGNIEDQGRVARASNPVRISFPGCTLNSC